MPLFELRLMDANANRAREGIRTAEDYLRFSIGESRWAARLKQLRTRITNLMQALVTDAELVASRGVQTDPLRPADGEEPASPTGGESPTKTAQRGLKRAQEALRVLEEFSRANAPATSVELSRCRYTLYEAEQWLLGSGEAAIALHAAPLYVLLQEKYCKRGLLATAEACLRGGARILQLREKDGASDRQLCAQARDLQQLCSSSGAVLICNDRPDLAMISGARGVHLGQDDLDPADVRKVAGEKILIGRSTHSVSQARSAAENVDVDYIAIGSMYETSTKDKRVITGVKLAEEVSALQLNVPVFAIGGIKLANIRELRAAGVTRVAVTTGIIGSDDPERATRDYLEALTA